MSYNEGRADARQATPIGRALHTARHRGSVFIIAYNVLEYSVEYADEVTML